MSAPATREILWNVNYAITPILMYASMLVALVICAIGIARRVELWSSGKPSSEFKSTFTEKIEAIIEWVLLQKGVLRSAFPGLMHFLIYVGFLALLFTTTMVFIDHDLGIRIYQGDFYLFVTVLSDTLGLGLLLGCALAAWRRYGEKADLVHNRGADSLVLVALALLIIQGFALEALRIHVTKDPWALYSPVGLLISKFFWSFSPQAAKTLHYVLWWFHTFTVFAVIAVVPYTKFFHIIASSINLAFRKSLRPKGALKFEGDLLQLMESGQDFSIGLGTIKDYSWKELLDLDACTSCGRCQDACPAYNSGKPLSPKWVILDTRNHALALHAKGLIAKSKLPDDAVSMDSFLTRELYLKSSGLKEKDSGGYDANGSYRAQNKLVQNASVTLGLDADSRIATGVIDANVFWSCTTCLACVEACPVGINHVDQIMGNRRNMVLMQGEIPAEAQGTLRALEARGNPFGPKEDRVKWLEGLQVKILKAGDQVDYLYWVGCVSAYDPRKQKIARSLVKLMQAANLSFGILGSNEGCSGDPARRLGEENLYQQLAKGNIELLKTLRFKTLVANCPHCFNTIKNEYPQLGNLGEVEIIHHSVLLKRLLAQKKLTLKPGAEDTYTFHDPCYLGRYNDEYEAPREALKGNSALKIIEMEKSKEKGFCCGAGGGHFWMDMKVGERVNVLRVEQAAETGAQKIATACPFCMQMMEDGIKLSNRESQMEVKDIAEVLAENLI